MGPCKVIRIGITKFSSRNPKYGYRLESGIQVPGSGIHSEESKIQDCIGSLSFRQNNITTNQCGPLLRKTHFCMKGEHGWRKMFLSLVSFFSVCLLSTAENVRIYQDKFNFVFQCADKWRNVRAWISAQ